MWDEWWATLKDQVIECRDKVDGISDSRWSAYELVLEMMAELEQG